MFNWFKNFFCKLKNIKSMVGDISAVNIKPEINTNIKTEAKMADTQNNKLIEINNNSQKNQIFYMGMSYQDVTDIVRKEISLANNKLMNNIEPQLLPSDLQKVQHDFDFLSTYDNAVKISAKRKDNIINKTIEEIIIDRIKTDNDFIKMVSNEAIKTIGKITNKQFEILHIMSLIYKCSIKNVKVTEDLIKNFKMTLRPLFDTDFKIVDFEYLSYVGCLFSIDPINIVFDNIFKTVYPKIDINELKTDEDYKFLESKWNSTSLCKHKLTTIGTYIGLKYNKVKLGFEIANIEKMFEL